MLPSSKEINRDSSMYHSQLNGVCNFENSRQVLQSQHENQLSGEINCCKPHTNVLPNYKTTLFMVTLQKNSLGTQKIVHYYNECEIDYTYYREWMRTNRHVVLLKSSRLALAWLSLISLYDHRNDIWSSENDGQPITHSDDCVNNSA